MKPRILTPQHRTAVFSLLVLMTVFSATVFSAPTWEGHTGQENGLPLVMNPTHPVGPDQVVQPKQLWRMGAEEDDALFGLIEDALVDEQGNTYLLDTVLSTIHVVNKQGEIIRTMVGEGDGPGEFRFAREFAFLPDGNLGIMEMMPGKVVVVDRDGTPRPSFVLTDGGQGAMCNMQHMAANDEVVILGQVVTNFGGEESSTEYTLNSYAADGSPKAVILENKVVHSGGNVSLDIGGGENEFTGNFTLCPDGRVVVFQKAHEYKLEIFDTDGTPRGVIRREYESVRRSDEALAEARRQNEEMQARFQGSVELQVEEYARDISDVIPRPDGEIWVANSRGNKDCPAMSVGFFDVFDRDGRYAHRVRIEADYDPARDNFRLHNNRLYVFKEARKAPPRTSTVGGSGGGMMVMMISGGSSSAEEEEEEEALPYEVICYELPD